MHTPPTVTIRPARETDLADILAMIRELAAFENLEDQLEVTPASLHESLYGSHPVAVALMAKVGSLPVGYAIYYYTFSSFAGRMGIHLDDVFVRPDWRKRGIATALLQEVAKIGADQNCKRFEWIALRWNQNALGLYDRLGAKTLDEWLLLRMDETHLKELAARKNSVLT